MCKTKTNDAADCKPGRPYSMIVDEFREVCPSIPGQPEAYVVPHSELLSHSAREKPDRKRKRRNSAEDDAGSARSSEDGDSDEDEDAVDRREPNPKQMKGVCKKYCKFEEFNDKTLKTSKPSGRVSLVECNGREYFFKAESKDYTDEAKALEFNSSENGNEGPRYGNRNIASRLFGELLGISAIVPSRFAFFEGNVGLLMDKAPGKTACQIQKMTGEEFRKMFPAAELAGLQKQLMDLETCDFLTGNSDRHDENYLVDVADGHVRVTGIDDDLSFGNADVTLPKLMSKGVADRIRTAFESEARTLLEDLLTECEIKLILSRLEDLRLHVSLLEKRKCLVEDGDWVDWCGPEPEEGWSGPEPKKANVTGFLCNSVGDVCSIFQRDFGGFFPEDGAAHGQ
jgi:hypothetical protein